MGKRSEEKEDVKKKEKKADSNPGLKNIQIYRLLLRGKEGEDEGKVGKGKGSGKEKIRGDEGGEKRDPLCETDPGGKRVGNGGIRRRKHELRRRK